MANVIGYIITRSEDPKKCRYVQMSCLDEPHVLKSKTSIFERLQNRKIRHLANGVFPDDGGEEHPSVGVCGGDGWHEQ